MQSGASLAERGREHLNTEHRAGTLFPDGESAFLTTSSGGNATELERLAAGDGDAWRETIASVGAQAELVFGVLGTELWSPAGLSLGAKAYRRLGRRGLAEFGAELVQSSRDWLTTTFAEIDVGNGTWDESLRERYADRIQARIARHVPNLESSTCVAWCSRRPISMQPTSTSSGDPYSGSLALDQNFLWRPFAWQPGTAPRRRPLPHRREHVAGAGPRRGLRNPGRGGPLAAPRRRSGWSGGPARFCGPEA